MAFLSWSEAYLIGNLTIDTEHKELFRLINSFHDRWQVACDHREIASLLSQLVAYAEMHFQHEEAIMAEKEYPRLEDHQRIHEAMFEKIFQLRQALEKQDTHLEMETIKFVKNWLVEHIVQSDYLFRDHLRRNKVDPDKEPVTEAQPSAAES